MTRPGAAVNLADVRIALLLIYLPVLLLVLPLLLLSVVLSLPYQRLRNQRDAERRRIGRPLTHIEYLFAQRVDGLSTHYSAGSVIRGLAYLVLLPVGRLASAVGGFLINTFGSYDD